MQRSHYDALGVGRNANKRQIKKAFRKKAKKLHPDMGRDPEKFMTLHEAYTILADETRRAEYDKILPPSNTNKHIRSKVEKSNNREYTRNSSKDHQFCPNCNGRRIVEIVANFTFNGRGLVDIAEVQGSLQGVLACHTGVGIVLSAKELAMFRTSHIPAWYRGVGAVFVWEAVWSLCRSKQTQGKNYVQYAPVSERQKTNSCTDGQPVIIVEAKAFFLFRKLIEATQDFAIHVLDLANHVAQH